MVAHCPPSALETAMDQLVSHNDVDVDSLDDMGVGGPGVTPLLACAFRSDNDAVLFAEILLRHGASVVSRPARPPPARPPLWYSRTTVE